MNFCPATDIQFLFPTLQAVSRIKGLSSVVVKLPPGESPFDSPQVSSLYIGRMRRLRKLFNNGYTFE